MARTWLRAAAVGAAALALAACGSGGQEAQSRPARGIAVDVGGRLAVLDGLDSEPRIVGERPPDTELLDGYHLAGARQLDRGLTVGIRQDTAMVVSTRDPMRAVMVGPAAALFPGTDGRRVWTVTEESPDTACAGSSCPPPSGPLHRRRPRHRGPPGPPHRHPAVRLPAGRRDGRGPGRRADRR